MFRIRNNYMMSDKKEVRNIPDFYKSFFYHLLCFTTVICLYFHNIHSR